MTTAVIRVPDSVHKEAARLAALRGQGTGELLAQAWREYMETHREQFASDLEQAAELLRNGTLDDLSDFTSRFAEERAEAAVGRTRRGRLE